MKHLIGLVKNVITTEYSVAALEHGRVNNSDHESFGIMLEEAQEASQEVGLVTTALENFWNKVKMDSDDSLKLEDLKSLECHAMLAACEFIQVAAMARKATLTIRERGEAK